MFIGLTSLFKHGLVKIVRIKRKQFQIQNYLHFSGPDLPGGPRSTTNSGLSSLRHRGLPEATPAATVNCHLHSEHAFFTSGQFLKKIYFHYLNGYDEPSPNVRHGK